MDSRVCIGHNEVVAIVMSGDHNEMLIARWQMSAHVLGAGVKGPCSSVFHKSCSA